MSVLRSVVRTAKTIVYFGVYGLDLAIRNPKSRLDRAAWLSKFCGVMLRAFDIEFKVQGEFPASGVLISNHTGYLDIVGYAAMRPVVYCAKAEMETWPFLGWMTKMTGTVFVDRGAGGSAEKAKGGMQAAEAEGVPVVFFPEGTTSDGSVVLPFRSGLLGVSLEAAQPITAAFVYYRLEKPNGRATVEKDVTFWGEHANMLKHIFNFMGLQGIRGYIRIADAPIRFSDTSDRKAAAVEARDAIVALAPPAVQEKSKAWDDAPAVVDYK